MATLTHEEYKLYLECMSGRTSSLSTQVTSCGILNCQMDKKLPETIENIQMLTAMEMVGFLLYTVQYQFPPVVAAPPKVLQIVINYIQYSRLLYYSIQLCPTSFIMYVVYCDM